MGQRRQLVGDEISDHAEHWTIVDHQVLATGNVSDFVRDTVETPSGETMVREYTMHPGAVGVIALDERNRVAVVRQYRQPVAFRLIEPPAGLLDAAGESFLAAAQRELAEEAKLAASDWRLLVDIFTTPGGCQESIRMYLARGLSEAPRPDGFVLEGEEAHMDICWVALDDLVAAILGGRVQSPSLVSGTLALQAALGTCGLDGLRAADSPWPARDAWAAQNAALALIGGDDRVA